MALVEKRARSPTGDAGALIEKKKPKSDALSIGAVPRTSTMQSPIMVLTGHGGEVPILFLLAPLRAKKVRWPTAASPVAARFGHIPMSCRALGKLGHARTPSQQSPRILPDLLFNCPLLLYRADMRIWRLQQYQLFFFLAWGCLSRQRDKWLDVNRAEQACDLRQRVVWCAGAFLSVRPLGQILRVSRA